LNYIRNFIRTFILVGFALMVTVGPVFQTVSRAGSVKFFKAVPFDKAAKGNLTSFLLGKKKQEPVNPFSICPIGNDRFCVTDAVNGTILILNAGGKVLKKISHLHGMKLIAPVSACGDPEGNLFISDSGLSMVLQLDAHYKFKNVFISQPGTTRITGIVFSRGHLFAVDTQNHRIICYKPTGRQAFAFGKRGTANGEFNFPTHITADDQHIYITDAMNFRVQIFLHSGKFVRTFGSMGRGGGNFSKPKGIAVDGKKRIFVADAMFDNIQIFSFKGEFLYYFGGPGHDNGRFWMPAGVMSGPDNTIWVADTYNHRLQLFHLREEEPQP